jgi:hypothetical protein
LPKKGSRIVNLATGRSIRYTVKDDNVTITLPKEASKTLGIALRIICEE